MLSTKVTRAALLFLMALLAAGVGALSAGNATRQEEPATKQKGKVAPPGPAEAKARVDKELAKLQGTWVVQSGPAGEIWVIAGEKFTSYSELGTGKVQINASKRPKTIDISIVDGTGVTWHGIYEVEADTLRVCFTLADQPRPTAFDGHPRMTSAQMWQNWRDGKRLVALWAFKRHAVSSVIAYDIVEIFYKNAARADEKYTGQQVTLTGPVLRVTGGGGGGSGYALLINGRRTDMPLSFAFSDAARKQLAKLEPRQVVTVQGQCRGRGRLEGVQEAILFDNARILRLPD